MNFANNPDHPLMSKKPIYAARAPSTPAEEILVKRMHVHERSMAFPAFKTTAQMREDCRQLARPLKEHVISWCGHLFGAEPEKGPGREQGRYSMPETREDGTPKKAYIRSFGRGSRIQFQRSKRRGIIRDGVTLDSDVHDDISKIDFYLIADTRRYPEIHVYKLRAGRLLEFEDRDIVSKSGMTPGQFDKFIRENLVVQWQDENFLEYLNMVMTLDRESAAQPLPDYA